MILIYLAHQPDFVIPEDKLDDFWYYVILEIMLEAVIVISVKAILFVF